MTKPVATFTAGTIHNPCRVAGVPRIAPQHNIVIRYPARLEAMALDPAKIATNDSLVYTAGQIDVCVGLYKTVTVSVDEMKPSEIVITPTTGRRALVLHAARMMQKALGIQGELTIDVRDEAGMRHCGLGSSSGTIATVASAINELYGHPVTAHDLSLYCAQNHGEEIDGNDNILTAVQCIGGSVVCGNYSGGIIVLAGEATPIAHVDVSSDYSVVIGVPHDFDHPDSLDLMQREEDNMDGFVNTGEAYGPQIAYRLVHEVLPALTLGDLTPCKSLVFDYRWDMGSIKNCSFVLPRINEIAESLRPLRDDPDVAMVSLSSVGPGFFALTTDPARIRTVFEAHNMKTIETTVHNGTYEIGVLNG